ncbi:response regulator, partial [candidate division GN15 bacterium]|nr:response regulator [candidate division GN15 bacterium]
MSDNVATQQARILVVDDEPEITEIVETFLTESGYAVSVENSPQNAIETIRQFKPDLVLLDIMMPQVDGYSICN